MSITQWALQQWAKVFRHDDSVPSAWPEWLANRDPSDKWDWNHPDREQDAKPSAQIKDVEP